MKILGFRTLLARLRGHRADMIHSAPAMLEPDSIPTRIGKYRIERELGRGGMGVVYVGVHEFLEARRAIKAILPEFINNGDAVARFVRECKALGQLDHENVVKIYDVEQEGDSLFYVMELLEGRSIASVIAEDGPMEWSRASAIVLQLVGALRAVHAKGIVHRDLGPGNIVLTAGDRVKIIDFGIVKLKEAGSLSASTLTSTGIIIGTPACMAPEQAQGQPVDHRTDIYSLGVVIYYMLTGCTPIASDLGTDASPLMILARLLSEDAPSMRTRPNGQNIPELVDRLVLKALARDPAQRFQDMGEFESAVRDAIITPQRRVRLAFVAALVGAALAGIVVGSMTCPAVEPTLIAERGGAASVDTTTGSPDAPRQTTSAVPAVTTPKALDAPPGAPRQAEQIPPVPVPPPADPPVAEPPSPRIEDLPSCDARTWGTAQRAIARKCLATLDSAWVVQFRVTDGRLRASSFGPPNSSIAAEKLGASCAISKINEVFSRCKYSGSSGSRMLTILH